MADVDNKMSDIRQAIYGEQVREALASGIEVINDEVMTTTSKADEAFEITKNLLDETFDASVITTNFGARLDTEIQNLQPEWTGFKNDTNAQLAQTMQDVNDRGVNLRSLGLTLDGVTDEYQLVMSALALYKNVVCPGDGVIATTETIIVGQGQSLIGLTENIRDYGKTAKIKYIGTLNRHKSVVRMGKNAVDDEPTLDGTDIQFRNFIVDANHLCGFGVYGTYLTNETAVDNIVDVNTLEYGQYYARAWYAKFTRLLSIGGKGQGVSFGMPLEYLDGTTITWTTSAPLEINNCIIVDIRAINCGKHFSVDNPNTFDPTNPLLRRKGYGIGFGFGNSFQPTSFTSEKSGGVNLYVYTGSQPTKVIKKGYLENGCLNSGLDPATTLPQIILENTNSGGGTVHIEDIFCNFNSGGIYHVGTLGRRTKLKNIHQPRFLKSLDGLAEHLLFAEVLKENVYFLCGEYNAYERQFVGAAGFKTVNSRYSFTVDVLPYVGNQLIYVKGDGTVPWGGYTLTYENGTTAAFSYPAGLGTTLTFSRVLKTVSNGGIVSITKSGGTGGTDSNVTFKVVNAPSTIA